ncbi:MAG: STAS domain-containing protein [Fibrobacteres bacterium]|nr:STAS domain-containing protein [Fibrobacterota bacterium]
MKTYKKGAYFYAELPEDLLDDYDDELEKILRNAINLNKYDIVIDLRNVSYLSSFTLRILMKNHKLAKEIGRNLVLVNIDEELKKFVSASRLDAVLPIYKDENEFATEHNHPTPHPMDQNATSGFSFEFREQQEVVIADISGVLEDAAMLQKFETVLFEKIKNGKTKFIFNLENLSFIDSLSIGRFVKFNRLLLTKNGKLIFSQPNELIRDFLSVLGLNDLISVCDNPSDALKAALN